MSENQTTSLIDPNLKSEKQQQKLTQQNQQNKNESNINPVQQKKQQKKQENNENNENNEKVKQQQNDKEKQSKKENVKDQSKQNESTSKQNQKTVKQQSQLKQQKQQQKPISQNKLHAIFDNFDKNRDHQITPKQLEIIAKQLNVKLSQEDIKTFIKEADTNGDKTVSFDQFAKWWKKNQNSKNPSKIASLIRLQQMILSKAKKISEKTSKYQNGLSKNIDKLNFKIQFGNNNQENILKFNIMFCGQKQEEIKNKITQYELNKLKRQILMTIQIQSNNPSKDKQQFIKQFQQLKKKQESQNNQILSILEVQSKVLQKSFIISFSASSLDDSFTEFIQFLKKQRLAHGQHAFVDSTAQFGFKAKLKGRQNDRFIHWICEGLTVQLAALGSSQYLEIFRKSIQAQIQNEYLSFIPLIQTGNFKLKFKTVQNVKKFFEKLGILQLSQQTPSLNQTFSSLKDFSKFIGITHEDHSHFGFVSDILKMGSKIADKKQNNKKLNLSIVVSRLIIQLNLKSDDIETLAALCFQNKLN